MTNITLDLNHDPGRELGLHVQGAHDVTGITPQRLEAAYASAEALTKSYSKSFYVATEVLPPDQRRAARALYGFCRVTDNLVDDPIDGQTTNGLAVTKESLLKSLTDWRHEVDRPTAHQTRDILIAWADTRERYAIPKQYANELIEGCEFDLSQDRYDTFAQLERYCYCVASTVGLMVMHIVGIDEGYTFEQAQPAAIQLGVALQLTNILRDVGEDLERGRIYLPREDLERFGVSEAMLIEKRLTPNVVELLRFEIARNHRLYTESMAGIGMLSKQARFAIHVAAGLYRGILGKIVANRYDVFTRRAHLSSAEKLIRMPFLWWRSRR